ncbi:hypothetical protein JCM11641_000334 [Rhodosporidiobolus odoratus]
MDLSTTPNSPQNAYLGIREGQSGLFFRKTSSAPTPSSGSDTSTARRRLGHSGIPLELFLRVMHYVRSDSYSSSEENEDDGEEIEGELALVRASQVCWGWRKAILGCGSLWSELEDLKVATFAGVERARAVAERAKGSLQTLSLDFHPSGDIPLSSLPVVVMFKQVLREISTKDGARKLEELELDLGPFKYVDDAEAPFQCIVLAAQFAEFSAVNLHTLRILTHLDRFPSGAPFFYSLPTLRRLVLTSAQYDPSPESRLPDFFQTTSTIESAQVSACLLRTLVLSGTSLMDGNFTIFPELRTLKLYNVKCSNLYGLLKKAPKLETLWLRRVTSDAANRFFPPAPGGGLKDLPPVLDLVKLSDVQIAGSSTPLLWLAPTQSTSHFIISTPVLKRCILSQQPHFDQQQAEDDGEGLIEAIRNLTSEALSTLFRNAGWLARLDLTSTNVTVEMLITSLPYASASLHYLKLGETHAATDELVDRLHTLVPQLKWLDVYGRVDYGAENRVSVQAVARLAERLKGLSPVRRWISGWEFTVVMRKPYTNDDPSLSDLRTTLRSLLLTLSPTQVEHLSPSSLILNNPPGALPYSVIRAEIIALSQPPPAPRLSPFSLSAKLPTLSSQADSAEETKKMKQKKNTRPPAAQSIVNQASVALKAYQLRKEQEGAIEFFEKNEREGGGLKLAWGTENCGEPGCGCGGVYPGGEGWRSGEDEDK